MSSSGGGIVVHGKNAAGQHSANTTIDPSSVADAIACMRAANPDATSPIWPTINALQAAYDFSQT